MMSSKKIPKTEPIVKQQTTRIGIYERVSSQEQAQHGVSLDEQSERLELLAKIEGWTVYDHYRDEGITGGTDKRPQLQRLLADARAGRIDLVVCTKLDRFFRNTRLLLNYIHQLEGYGVAFVAQAEGIDTRNPGIGKIMLSLLGSIAEWERERIGQRISDFRQHLAGKGQWSSGRTPFGYRFDKKHKVLEIEESEARAVRFAFDTYTRQPMGIIRLAEAMNIEALITPRMGRRQHNTWTQSAVRHILTHPAYMGGPNENWRFNTPMIVEPETWDRAQQRLSENRHFQPANAANRPEFNGRLRCSICGRTLRVGYSHNTKQVYECPGRLKRNHLDGSDRCALPRFDAKQLDESLNGKLQKLASNPDLLADYIRNTINNLKSEQESLQRRLKPLNTEALRVQEDMAILDAKLEMRRMDPGTYKDRMKALESNLNELKQRRNQADPCQLDKLETLLTLNDDNISYHQEILEAVNSTQEGKHQLLLNNLQNPAYSEGDEYMEWVGLPYTIANRLTGIVSPDRTVELKGNVKVGQSLVSPSYKNDRGLPLSIRIELPELAGVK